jgi:putative Mn2+ efflux pump MntP
MGFLLLGVDSLIACIAVGPIMSRRLLVLTPFVLLFGVGDGGGYLLGTAFHWSVPDNVSNIIETGFLVILGIYWIGLAIYSKWAAKQELQQTSKAHWGVWILPFALSVDNITYGLVNGIPAHYSVWLSAGEQALSSSAQAAIGLGVGIGLAALFPVMRRRMALANGVAGGLLIAAAGVLLVVG